MANAILAVILSFFIPGLGQLYAGRFLRGVLVFVVVVVLAGILYYILPYAALIVLIIWIWNLIDAYMLAAKKSPFLLKSP